MPPLPPIPTVLEPRQSTISFNGPRIIVKKPGKPAKPVQEVHKNLNRRWLLGSPYENVLVRQFRTARIAHYNPNESDPKSIALHRYSYPRELKLAAIE
jgi:hypothetical protein